MAENLFELLDGGTTASFRRHADLVLCTGTVLVHFLDSAAVLFEFAPMGALLDRLDGARPDRLKHPLEMR
jgi:hypothetical protein